MSTELIEPAQPAAVPAVSEQPGSLLAAIVALAKDPSVDVQKLGALVAMQREIEADGARRAFIKAFARLTADLPRVRKNGTIRLIDRQGADKGSIAFARWEDMDKIIRPLLVREGFTLSFDSAIRPGEGGGLIVTGTLMHEEGHTRTASMPLSLDAGPGRNNLQAMGSTLSYGKRYCTEMLLNIVREGNDDDGNGGTVSTEQAAELDILMRETKTDPARFLAYFDVSDIRALAAANFVPAKNMLLAKSAKRGSAAE